jgi:hypothetical protein
MHRNLSSFLAFSVASLLASSSPLMAQSSDPAAVLDAYTAAINAHDIDAALVDGETVTRHSKVTLEGPQQVIENNSRSVVHDGKIAMHTAKRAE